MSRWWTDAEGSRHALSLVGGDDVAQGVGTAVLGYHGLLADVVRPLSEVTLVDAGQVVEAIEGVDLTPVCKALASAVEPVMGDASQPYAEMVLDRMREATLAETPTALTTLTAAGLSWPQAVGRVAEVVGVPARAAGSFYVHAKAPTLNTASAADRADRTLMEWAAAMGAREAAQQAEVTKADRTRPGWDESEVERDEEGRFATEDHGEEDPEQARVNRLDRLRRIRRSRTLRGMKAAYTAAAQQEAARQETARQETTRQERPPAERAKAPREKLTRSRLGAQALQREPVSRLQALPVQAPAETKARTVPNKPRSRAKPKTKELAELNSALDELATIPRTNDNLVTVMRMVDLKSSAQGVVSGSSLTEQAFGLDEGKQVTGKQGQEIVLRIQGGAYTYERTDNKRMTLLDPRVDYKFTRSEFVDGVLYQWLEAIHPDENPEYYAAKVKGVKKAWESDEHPRDDDNGRFVADAQGDEDEVAAARRARDERLARVQRIKGRKRGRAQRLARAQQAQEAARQQAQARPVSGLAEMRAKLPRDKLGRSGRPRPAKAREGKAREQRARTGMPATQPRRATREQPLGRTRVATAMGGGEFGEIFGFYPGDMDPGVWIPLDWPEGSDITGRTPRIELVPARHVTEEITARELAHLRDHRETVQVSSDGAFDKDTALEIAWEAIQDEDGPTPRTRYVPFAGEGKDGKWYPMLAVQDIYEHANVYSDDVMIPTMNHVVVGDSDAMLALSRGQTQGLELRLMEDGAAVDQATLEDLGGERADHHYDFGKTTLLYEIVLTGQAGPS